MMGSVGILTVLALAAALAGWRLARARRATAPVRRLFQSRQWEAWRAAANRSEVNIRKLPGRAAGENDLEGWHAGFEVRMQTFSAGFRTGTWIRVVDRKPVATGLTVRRIAPSEFDTRQPSPELLVGDPDFDRDFVVTGEELLMRAVLDVSTREQLAAFLKGKVPVEGGIPVSVEAEKWESELEAFVTQSRLASAEELEQQVYHVLGLMLSLSRRLVMPPDLAYRIARHASTDREVGVRWRCLRLLVRELPKHPATGKALQAAWEDQSEEVRIEAALGRALLGSLDSVGLLEARALALSVLARPDSDLALGATNVLAKVGTSDAVPVLRGLESRGDRELTRAARQAIAEIQARLEGAGAGQLSLAGSEAGTLSISEEREAGRVSLAEETAGELPRPARAAIVKAG